MNPCLLPLLINDFTKVPSYKGTVHLKEPLVLSYKKCTGPYLQENEIV